MRSMCWFSSVPWRWFIDFMWSHAPTLCKCFEYEVVACSSVESLQPGAFPIAELPNAGWTDVTGSEIWGVMRNLRNFWYVIPSFNILVICSSENCENIYLEWPQKQKKKKNQIYTSLVFLASNNPSKFYTDVSESFISHFSNAWKRGSSKCFLYVKSHLK